MFNKIGLISLVTTFALHGMATAATFSYVGYVDAPRSIGGDKERTTFSGTVELEVPPPFTGQRTDGAPDEFSDTPIGPITYTESNVIDSTFNLYDDSSDLILTSFILSGEQDGYFRGEDDFQWLFADRDNPVPGYRSLDDYFDGFTLPLVRVLFGIGDDFEFRDLSDTPSYAQGSVTFTPVAEVPLPAAAWFFLTALLGAGWWRRRVHVAGS
ncbi:MAG: VPLPA-CTERM sorting domain-containing protein [Pseudomonadota bacterium]